MNTLTANQLALYLGCKCEITDNKQNSFTGILAPIDLSDFNAGHAHIKPILRPLDTLGDDRRHIAALMFPGRGSYYNDCFRNEVHDNFENDVHVGFTIYSTDRNYDNIVVKYNKLSPLQFKYILEIGGDIFGWIEQGLAFDKTKLK